jgi:cytidylate kinase
VTELLRSRPIVAIDGPAGAGKSTVARHLADALDFVLVDTGAMYRAVALAARRRGVPWTEGDALGRIARDLVSRRALVLGRSRPNARNGRGELQITLDGDDVTEAIRTPEIGLGASAVSAHGPVREALLDLQRQAGSGGGVVLEGRDIGTVVFPNADVKFFLTARPEVRARRRFDELVAKGALVTYEQTLDDVRQRDNNDTTRTVAPLRKAPDAMLVDNSAMTVDDTVATMVERVKAWNRL